MLAICRDHGQPPSWWVSLSTDDRAQLLAFRMYEAEEAKRAMREAKR